jgi:hypothetical protein
LTCRFRACPARPVRTDLRVRRFGAGSAAWQFFSQQTSYGGVFICFYWFIFIQALEAAARDASV